MMNYAENLPRIRRLAPNNYGALVNEMMPTALVVDIASPTSAIRNKYPNMSERDLLELYYQAVAHFRDWNSLDPVGLPDLEEHRLLDLGMGRMTDGQRHELTGLFYNLYSEVRAIFIHMGMRELIAADGAFSYTVRILTNNGNVMILDYLST